MSSPPTTTTTTTTTTTATSNTTSNNTPPPPIEDKSADRIKKRDPGGITKVIKCGVVGDGTVGKTTLLLSYITQAFITEYTPTVFDNFSAIEEVDDGKLVNVILWDTAGQDDYAQIRTTCYTNCRYDVFLLCFSCVNRDSFDNVKYKWLPELKANSPGTPFILVGTKTDMRDESEKQQANSPPLTGAINPNISSKEGQKRAKEIKAHSYMECTSRDPASVAKVVLEAINIIIEKERLKRVNNEKQWKKEVKKEEKEEKSFLKAREKYEQKQKSKEEKKKPNSPNSNSPPSTPEQSSPQSSKKSASSSTSTSPSTTPNTTTATTVTNGH
ncbi:hypothetical protein CYY_003452 [Polysphondylium violaceum]|uniref:Rho GTPase n=1 Tax=Polysphondylium violaceum TaxID=133409 RepID=A0A8J4PZN8_9MYCE|nr:hypothetical protein CYY_003452 [Polysphondylium violaceum]